MGKSSRSSALGEVAAPGEAFEQVYRRHHEQIRRYVERRFGLRPPEPEDVTQAAFVKFALLDPGSVANPIAFLRRTARNIVIDEYRLQGRTVLMLRDVKTIEESRHDSSVEDVLSSRQELERVDAAIASLKPKQRVVFMMHRVDGMSFAEIGRELGLSESGARKLARKAIAECMRALRRQDLQS